MNESSPLNLRNLDVLRGVLALEVLLGHARWLLWMPWWQWSQLPHPALTKFIGLSSGILMFGNEAVMVFFVLSGFFIHLRLALGRASGCPQSLDVRDYFRRRARRILPPYYAALILTVVCDAVGHTWFPQLYDAQTGDAMLDQICRDSGYGMKSVAPALLALPDLLLVRFGSNGALWSVGMEVFFYLLYPAFAWLWTRSRAMAYMAGLGVSLVAYAPGADFLFSRTLSYYPLWLLGALLADWLSQRNVRPHSSRDVLAGLALALIGLAGCRWQTIIATPLLLLLSRGLMGAGAVFGMAHVSRRVCDLRGVRWMEWIGLRSYSLYVFHLPVFFLMSAMIFARWGVRPQHGWFALLGSVLAILTGVLGWHLVERRFLPRRLVLEEQAR